MPAGDASVFELEFRSIILDLLLANGFERSDAERRADELASQNAEILGQQLEETNAAMVTDFVLQVQESGGELDDALAMVDDIATGDERLDRISIDQAVLNVNDAALDIADKNGQGLVLVRDGINCLPERHAKLSEIPARLPSGRAGVVELDAEAHGQQWTIKQARGLWSAHPRCVRQFLNASTGAPIL